MAPLLALLQSVGAHLADLLEEKNARTVSLGPDYLLLF